MYITLYYNLYIIILKSLFKNRICVDLNIIFKYTLKYHNEI